MHDQFAQFEKLVRSIVKRSSMPVNEPQTDHPLETRNIHPLLPNVVKKLFDDGHYAQATFEAFKFVDKEVARLAKSEESGFKLMMTVFSENSPALALTDCKSVTSKDEQKGFQFLFAGSILAIRNPRGHEYGVRDTPDECLDHLVMASILLRRLEATGFKLKGSS